MRPLGPYTDVPRDDIDKWLAVLREMGVRSNICLLDVVAPAICSRVIEGLVLLSACWMISTSVYTVIFPKGLVEFYRQAKKVKSWGEDKNALILL
jgi:hypothetical protein